MEETEYSPVIAFQDRPIRIKDHHPGIGVRSCAKREGSPTGTIGIGSLVGDRLPGGGLVGRVEYTPEKAAIKIFGAAGIGKRAGLTVASHIKHEAVIGVCHHGEVGPPL